MQPAYPRPPAPLRLASAESVFQNAREYFDKGELPLFGSVFADEQKAGHGQYNRAWESRRGNVHAAIRLPLAGVWQTAASATALAALIADELEALGYAVLIKWPNDIVALTHKGAAKGGGILLKEIGGLLTAGIGLNLSWAPGADLLREGGGAPRRAARGCRTASSERSGSLTRTHQRPLSPLVPHRSAHRAGRPARASRALARPCRRLSPLEGREHFRS